ncbi:MAG: GNAT family N-acetyltransferase [Gammaproteobacteria bacterium]|jgi:GNAT superfamily N-acetyltransferase
MSSGSSNSTGSAVLAVRVAVTNDAAVLAALVNSAYRGDSSRAGWTTEADLLGGQRTDLQALEEFMAQTMSVGDRAMLVHESARQILACVQLERRGDGAYLGMLTITPTLQAKGLGRRLLAAAEHFARTEWQARRIIMTVIEQRLELIAWYQRRGYAPTGETAPFPYGDPRFGEPKRPDLRFVVLAKDLVHGPVTVNR